ncbi:MAG TPA: EAL domain-containing protein [Devosiaceae bacterium]|nr:EAL domain-containing protein [Devosiaceae bacterium]
MPQRRPIIATGLLTVLTVGLFAVGGHFAASALISTQVNGQLGDLVQLALRRSEAAVDYGYEALRELGNQGTISCDPAALQSLRLRVYQRGPVKDIRIARPDGAVLCSAYSETLEFDRIWPRLDEMPLSSDGALRLFRVDQLFGTALGVLMQSDADSALIAILAVNTSLLDVMPAELRADSAVALELSDGRMIAEQLPSRPFAAADDILEFAARSDRLPLRSVIRVNARTVEGWNHQAYRPILALSGALGLLFGLLLGRAAGRPDSPAAVLDRAIARREFKPFLQPVFDLASGEITGCEMLARWVRADGTVVPPSRFIALAEDNGRIAEITWQMLESALAGLQPLMRRTKTFRLAVNISPGQFMAPGFTAQLRRVVAAAQVARRQIVVELTEREELGDLEAAAAIVAELQRCGFLVAIDDVGIGHSGLSHLQRLGANILKIDKFFIDSINHDDTARSIVDMLVRLADRLQMSLVAEGIEDRRQIETLLECGVVSGQGFVVAPPLPVPAFLELVERPAAGAQAPAVANVA